MIRFTEGGRQELPEIVSLNESIFRGVYERPPYTLEEYWERLSTRNSRVMLAHDDNVLVGNIIFFPRNGAEHVWILGVSEEYQRRGVGTGLLEIAEGFAFMNGCDVTTKVYRVSEAMQKILGERNYFVEKTEPHPRERKWDELFYRLRVQA